jgi:aminoglycoside phosphotransferase (APT) family kinase protein
MPRVAALMRARLTGMPTQDPTLPSLEDAVRMCGHIAAELHESGIELGAPRPFDGEAVMLGSFAELMRPVSPGLAERFDEWLGAVKAEAASQPAQPRVFTHGDFSYTQLILDGRSMGLVDFDTVCQAEPAMDIGHFFAYLQLAGRKAGGAARDEVTARLRTEFLSAYIDHRGLAGADAQPLIGRVKTYEMLSLLRLAAHGWQKLKPSRLRYIVAAIDDHVGRPGHF